MAGRRGNNEGSFRKRSMGGWEYRVTLGVDADGHTIRRSIYGKTKAVCLEKWEDLRKSDKLTVSKKMRVGEWADKWLITYKSGVQSRTYDQHESLIRNYIKPSCIGGMRLTDVRPLHIQEILNACKDKSSSFRKKLRGTIWSMFDRAIENDLCTKNPAAKIRVEEDVGKPIFDLMFTVEECDRIKQYCLADGSNVAFAVTIMLYTGLRRGEVCGLQWGDVDLEKGLITIRRVSYLDKNKKALKPAPKTRAGFRELAILPPLADALRSAEHTSLFLVHYRNGEFYNVHNFSQDYDEFMEKIENVRKIGTHAYRRSLATHLHAAGVSLQVIQAILGHSNISVTSSHYTGVSIDLIKAEMNKLPY